MTAERIDDERLAEFIEQLKSSAEDWKQIDKAFSQIDPSNNEDDSAQYYQDRINLLLELQSRRQAEREAIVGAEKLAEKLTRFVEAKISAYLPGDITLPEEESQAIRELLAPLYAKLADLNKQLLDAMKLIHDQATTVARQAALLGECRKRVNVLSCIIQANGGSAEKYGDLLNRIDAEVGGKAVE